MAIDVILASIKLLVTLVDPDNIVIFSMTPEKPIDHGQQMLKLLQGAGVTFKFKIALLYGQNRLYRTRHSTRTSADR